MQFLNYLLLLNIRFPANLNRFVDFFDVATGQIAELEGILPTLPSFVLDSEQLDVDYSLLPEKFAEQEIESPYFLVAYQQTIFVALASALIIVPGYIISKKYNVMKEFFGQFKYNAILRVCIEIYLDLTLICCINLANVRVFS